MSWRKLLPMAWLGEFSSKSKMRPKNSCLCARRGTGAISLIIVEPTGARVQLSASQMLVLGGPCHAPEPAGLSSGASRHSSSRAHVPAKQLTSASSETLRSFIAEERSRQDVACRGPLPPCQAGTPRAVTHHSTPRAGTRPPRHRCGCQQPREPIPALLPAL